MRHREGAVHLLEKCDSDLSVWLHLPIIMKNIFNGFQCCKWNTICNFAKDNELKSHVKANLRKYTKVNILSACVRVCVVVVEERVHGRFGHKDTSAIANNDRVRVYIATHEEISIQQCFPRKQLDPCTNTHRVGLPLCPTPTQSLFLSLSLHAHPHLQ